MGICKITALQKIIFTSNQLDLVMSFDELKNQFGAPGKQNWWNFNNYYLSDAVKSVNITSYFLVSNSPIKTGRRITHVNFQLRYRRLPLQDCAERRAVKPARVRSFYGARPLSSTAN